MNEWSAVLVVRHRAGSDQAAADQCHAMVRNLELLEGCEVVSVASRPDSAVEVARNAVFEGGSSGA